MTNHADALLNAILITNNEHQAGTITDQHASSVYLGAIASSLTSIQRHLADIANASRRENRPIGSCGATYPTGNAAASSCTHDYNHTGAHRLPNGRTW